MLKPPSIAKPEIKRMNLHVDVRLHNAFKAATAAQGTTMTDVLLAFIRQYVEERRAMIAPKKARGR